jgi:hypothetical protein
MTDNTHYVTDGKLSIKLGSTSTTMEHTLGSRTTGNNGTVWRYVKATVAVSAYDTVTFPNTWIIQPATPTTVATGGNVGFAQVAFAAGEYGWVCTEADKITVSVSATTTAAIQLYIATTSGKLSTTSSSGTLGGVFVDATTSASTGVTLTTAIARAPHYKVL